MRSSTYHRALVAGVVVGAAVLASGIAGAAPPWNGCPVGPSADNPSSIAAWQRLDVGGYAGELTGLGLEPDVADEIAAATFEHDDGNGDGHLCVMRQQLPNDASGSDVWFVIRDNTARPGSS